MMLFSFLISIMYWEDHQFCDEWLRNVIELLKWEKISGCLNLSCKILVSIILNFKNKILCPAQLYHISLFCLCGFYFSLPAPFLCMCALLHDEVNY